MANPKLPPLPEPKKSASSTNVSRTYSPSQTGQYKRNNNSASPLPVKKKTKALHMVLAACLVTGLLVALSALLNVGGSLLRIFSNDSYNSSIYSYNDTESADSVMEVTEYEEALSKEEEKISDNLDKGLIEFDGSDLKINTEPGYFSLVTGSYMDSANGGCSYSLYGQDGEDVYVEQMKSDYPFSKSEEEEYFMDDLKYLSLDGKEDQFYVLQEDGYDGNFSLVFADRKNGQTINFTFYGSGDSTEKKMLLKTIKQQFIKNSSFYIKPDSDQ